jgi:beta-lactam-binding protein with PASTA domain
VNEEEDFFRPPVKSPVPTAVIVSIITTVALFFVLRFLDERGAFPFATKIPSPAPAVVEVPSLLGMRPEQAREILRGHDLLLSLSVERDSAQFPAGTIAEQTPLLGSQLARGGTIQAVLSRGLRQLPVPKVAGLKTDDASKQLIQAGFSLGRTKSLASETAQVGVVVDTEPPAGTPLAPQAAVALIVSSGPTDKPVPRLTGLHLRAARDLLEQQGFQVGKIRHGSDDARAVGVVLDQKPLPDAPAAPGTLVDLTVNED